MNRTFFLYLLSFMFLSLPVLSPIDISEKNDGGTIIEIDNPTVYDVYFDGGQRVAKRSNGTTVTLYIETGTLSRGFEILYEIPLTDTVPFYVKGDYRTFRENQLSFTITEPRLTGNYGTYIIIQNSVNNAISFNTGGIINPSWEQRGNPKVGNYLTFTNKREFSPGETVVFDISRDFKYDNYFIRDSGNDISLVLPQNVKKNYVYAFNYTNQGIELTDSRPLHRVGEPSWPETIKEAKWIMPLVVVGNEIHLFASTDKNITRYVYNSTGNLKEQVQNGDKFKINTAIQAGDGFLIAGETDNRNTRPVARIHNVDGTTRHIFEPSNDYPTGRFFSVSQQNENAVWLLAGDGKKTSNPNNLAYARLVQNEGGKFSTLWELGGSDFSDYGSGIYCGDIQSTAYDNKRACWLVTGETIEKGIVSGSYIAEIDNNGKIKINSPFKGMTFYKILTNHEGVCFLAGEEYRGNETYAVLIKYDLINGQFQRIPTRPPLGSSYYDAAFDHEKKLIVLAGVMQEENKHGHSGVPFIESVNIESGTSLWREKLSVPASLVTAIAPAPDYGFALTLSGIYENDNYNEPFMIIRVNSQGKL